MYTIEIKNGFFGKIYKHRKFFAQSGFTFTKKKYGKSYYSKRLKTENEEKYFINFCKKHFLKYNMIPDKYIRSSTYRKEFMKKFENKDKMICAYCGFKFQKEQLTVDHIIPIHKAKYEKFPRILMKILNIENINSTKNLVAACDKCNKSKSSKMGNWVIRGFIGKSEIIWYIRWILRIILITIAIYNVIIIWKTYEISNIIQNILKMVSVK